jgi:hypothetical protein
MNKQSALNLPVIAGVEIFVDSEGRYNLNALHKASGGAKKDGPSYWLAIDTTKKLITAVKETTDNPVVSKEGRNGGTFAHELLAVSYAGWISPEFQLTVNQTFIDYRTGKLRQPLATNLTVGELFKAQAEAYLVLERQQTEMQARSDKVVHAVKSEIKKRKKIEKRLEAIKTASKYFTIVGYVSYAWGYSDNRLPLKEAQAMGRKASKYCSEQGISIGQTNDERYGMINTYPLDILEQLFPLPNYKTNTRRLKLQSSSRH